MLKVNSGFTLFTVAVGVGLFAIFLLALWIGQRLSRERLRDAKTLPSSGSVGATIFALLGLLIAFMFSGAAGRFDDRRDLIVQESNAIGTAYLRLDMLQPAASAALKDQFRRYLDARIHAYQAGSIEEFGARLAHANGMQRELWSKAVEGAKEAGGAVPLLLLPAVNELIDVSALRDAATEKHPPAPVYAIMTLLAVLAALLAGLEMHPGQPVWVLKIMFATTISLTLWLTFDLEHPRQGLIRVTDTDHFLIDLRRSLQ